MFNLPTLTWLVLFGMPALWVLYTLGFLWVSRNWAREEYDAEPGQ